ncbi:MAG TPA: aldo/keto reductase [Limnochordia bacterium]|nr:aldo/keto reductase [Limnochordia bacterium]
MSTVKYDRVQGLDRPLSKLVLGTMGFNLNNLDTAFAVMDRFVELGGNCLDTAFIYAGGQSEQVIGRWLQARGIRDEIAILGKGGHPDANGPKVNPEAVERDLATSLERMGLDSIDMYVLHRDDPSRPVGEMIDYFNEQKARGRINLFGGSNWSTKRLDEANAYAAAGGLEGYSLSSPNVSLAKVNEPRWAGCVSLDRTDLEWHAKKQFPAFSWSSQAGGFFTGRFSPEDRTNHEMVRVYYSDANWERLRRARELAARRGTDAIAIALAWVLNQPFPIFALIGPLTVAELESSVKAIDVELSPEELDWLDLAE